jgi:uncharacterized iron-regulated membrane protein
MRTVRLLHRWLGGLLGLLLAVLGLSGALLVYKDAWLRASVPHAAEAPRLDPATVGAAVERLLADPRAAPNSVVLASRDVGVHRLYRDGEAGAYADQSGNVVVAWESVWERPELWLFDLHHHLLAGETGETVAGLAALAGLGFVVTGLVLWWRTWRRFAVPLWPRPMARQAIIRHHRDLGALLAPLLALSLLTGTMMTLPPVANLLLSPLSSRAAMEAAAAPPPVEGGPLSPALDWPAALATAQARFPDAELRVIGLPRRPGELIRLRLRQPAEWLPNGRTAVYLDPADGRVVEARDALAMPAGSRAFSLVYPLHAAKVGGLAFELALTATGLGLALLGSLTVWSFWGAQLGKRLRRGGVTRAAPG